MENDLTDLNLTFANKHICLGVAKLFANIVCPTQLYDHDKDGILNFKETQKVLRCLGLRVSEDQAKILIKKVSADRFGYSASFNEYLRLVSIQRRREPDEECLLGTYRGWAEFYQQKINDYFFCPSVSVLQSLCVLIEIFR